MSYRSAYRGAGYQRATREHLYVDPGSVSASTAFTYVAIVVLGGYLLVHHLDIFPTLPLSQLVWNIFVYVTPSSLVIALEHRATTGSSIDPSHSYANTRTFAAKSEAMRRMLGLSSGGLSYATGRSRSLSGLGMMFKHTSANSLPGLGNWDNSCYQNSILQGLSALPSLQNFLDTTGRTIPGAASRSTNLALIGLIEELNNPKNRGQKFWTPPVLKSMSSWQQQDAQEYYSKVVDALEKELGKGLAQQTTAKGLERQPEVNVPGGDKSGKANDTRTQNPLEGMLAQRVGCLRCGYVEGLSLIPFNCLTLPLGNRSTYDLAGCLDEYTGLEPINGVECARCTLLQQKDVLQKLLSVNQSQAIEAKVVETEESKQEPHETEPMHGVFMDRLNAVNAALEEEDFSDATLSKKCLISSKQRIQATKTRQAVIARQPHALVIHVNRSLFDEYTGALRKNYADVRFPKMLDLSRWTLGRSDDGTEKWSSNPAESILDRRSGDKMSSQATARDDGLDPGSLYTLKAVVTHQGRHENGHYIAFRRDSPIDNDEMHEQSWWRLSDEDVTTTNEEAVLGQGGVFMLFYEQATTAEKEKYLRSLNEAQTGEYSADENDSALAVADPECDSASIQPLLPTNDAPATSLGPGIATSEAETAALLASFTVDPDITPLRRSSLQPSVAPKAAQKEDQEASMTGNFTSLPSSIHNANMTETSPPSIPERKTSKPRKRGKKSKRGTDSQRVVHMRTSGVDNGERSSPLGSPQPGMVSAQ